MGVLGEGTPYLNQRGLAALCRIGWREAQDLAGLDLETPKAAQPPDGAAGWE